MPAVSIRLPHAVPLGKVDASITIDKHGELYISKGTVEMRPLGKQNHVYTLSWTKLMRLFEEHGKPAVKPTKTAKAKPLKTVKRRTPAAKPQPLPARKRA